MPVDCYSTFDETCGDTGAYAQADNGTRANPSPSAGAPGGSDILNWIGTLTGVGVGAYTTVNRTPAPVRGLGIAGSPGQMQPLSRSVGTGTIIAIFLVGILVWFGVRRAR